MPTADREEVLFAAVMEIPTRAERAAYLKGACGGDDALRLRVEALLAAHDGLGGVLDAPPSVLNATAAHHPLAEVLGTKIGPYKLLQQIGEGGMGVVYMAEQQEPVRRKVALKIIKPGMDSQQVIARFEAERQALAMMDHQNIARVLDAGTVGPVCRTGPDAEGPARQARPTGQPYFVMELVHGVPITQFCDDNKLTPRERLALFVPVCQAIQHAHQKGIIHRDVKPSNVLVTMYDDKPVPKVIDFGVAKAIEQRLTEKTLFTQFGALVGTFEYMSPEQAEMNAFGVDTRSDIFSLGVLLYELLTGTTPLERTRLRAAALGEMVRLIKEEEAPRPSVRLSSSNNLPKIAAARKTEPARLSKLIRGEIDWIVMKCLEKDRSRRYDTASGLGRDVERYLADEPVEACPPSASYRLRKFARKYNKALAIAAAFAILLVAGVVLSTLLAVRATSAEHEATRQRNVADAAKQKADEQRDEARLTAYATGIGLAQRSWDENNVVRARELLQQLPKEAAGRDLRGFEWYYLSRLCLSEVPTLKGHSGPVWSVAFSPDGQRLASGSFDKTVRIWDSTTGKELVCLEGHSDRVISVAYSPDGQRLASGSVDKTVRIWDVATGKEQVCLTGHAEPVSSVAFSPDGQRLASGSGDKTVKIWDVANGKELVSLKGHANGVLSVAFSPDGLRLASASTDRTVRIWDSTTGKELLSYKGHADGVISVAFSPDGQRLASGGFDKTVRIWDSANGKELVSLKGHAHWVMSVAFSPDGQRLASASYDSTIRIWNSTTGKELFSLKGHADEVTSVAFSPDGQRLASTSSDKTVKIWDSANGNDRFSLKGHASWVARVAFSPDGKRLASGSEDKTVKLWDVATGKELFSIPGHAGTVYSVAFSPDGQRLASASYDKIVKTWDSATGKELLPFKTLSNSNLNVVAFSPDGQRLASGSSDTTVKIWDSKNGKELFSFVGHAGHITYVAFSPDGQRLASGSSDKTVKIWDVATGKELFSLHGHDRTVLSVAFSPDGQRLASGSEDKTVKIWDGATGKQLVSLKGHANWVASVAFSPDGQRLASGSFDSTVRIWNSTTGTELVSLNGHAGKVTSVAFSPDGQRLASTGGDGSINLWETSVSPDLRERRAVNQVVADLFRQTGLRTAVLERLRTSPGMSPSRRQAAFLTALGVAHYRVGNDHKALEMLLRSEKIIQEQKKGSIPANLPFLARTQHRLGHAKEAQVYLQRLRERMKDPRWARNGEVQGFLREAEALLAEPKSPCER